MKIPLSWLNEFVKIDDIDPRELAEKLTRAGLQVESIETVGAAPLADEFVAAEIVECEMHPDSDHLHVCKVFDGKDVLQIVCGAPNARKGLKTALAKIGAVVPDGGFKIKKGKLRGVESFGMLCSSKELKLPGGDHSGIMELDPSVVPGAFLRDVVGGEKPEVVFDIEVTWNRPDALSVVGIAREFGAILSREVKTPAVDFPEEPVDVNSELKVRVEDPVKCPRYTARVLTHVEDAPSPEIIAKRLELCGVRSLGIVVDITNYVMLELGQPLHAFDHTRLEGREIVVRCAASGETIKTLDGQDRKLSPSMLVICDAKSPNAVAGVMGGADSEIREGTTSVALESALFDPASIKETSTALGLSSESSYRYIRGVGKDLADFASRRAAHLYVKYAKAKVASSSIDIDNRVKPLNPDVALDFDRARKLIGIPVDNDTMVGILRSLGLEPRCEGPYAAAESVSFGIPPWRWDLSLEADLVEEVARLYGLDNIPDTMPSAPSVSSLDETPFRATAKLRSLCLSLGFTEAMHYSFLSSRELDQIGAGDKAARLAIPDPVSADYSVMRDSLVPQMVASLGRNFARQIESVMLFEIGKAYLRSDSAPVESGRVCLGFAGPVARGLLSRRAALSEEEAVLWMKGAVETLLGRLKAGKTEFRAEDAQPFENGAALAVVLNGRKIGMLGAVSKKHRHPYRMTTQMVVCEMEIKPLLKRFDAVGRVSAPPQYPLVRRDVALVVNDASVVNATIVAAIAKSGAKYLVKTSLFDVFKPKGAAPGVRSLAYTLEFRSPERTLTDAEVAESFARVVAALKAIPGVEVREG
ncbi:MAG: phenylalanine--tRNA ligase subunit beta [Kiritimatiellae bacterium]|nr:phenylalanine--tRNA ligase subunit beta [Kiritimatiellia bacterium]